MAVVVGIQLAERHTAVEEVAGRTGHVVEERRSPEAAGRMEAVGNS